MIVSSNQAREVSGAREVSWRGRGCGQHVGPTRFGGTAVAAQRRRVHTNVSTALHSLSRTNNLLAHSRLQLTKLGLELVKICVEVGVEIYDGACRHKRADACTHHSSPAARKKYKAAQDAQNAKVRGCSG